MENTETRDQEREAARPERDREQFEELAEKIVVEVRKLGRPVDMFDIPSLAALIEGFFRQGQESRRNH